MVLTGLILLALGIIVWLFGNRMWLLGAGAGALLGFGLTGLFPSLAGGWTEFFIVAACAVIFGGLGFIGKAFAKIIAMVLGFIAGGAVLIGFMNLLGMGVSFWTWIGALVGGLDRSDAVQPLYRLGSDHLRQPARVDADGAWGGAGFHLPAIAERGARQPDHRGADGVGDLLSRQE